MAETADINSPQAPGQLEEPSTVHLNSPGSISPGTDAREATELARLRSNYTRATSYRQAGLSVASIKPDGFLERFSYTVRAFWRRQISITVAHETCRDHLGKPTDVSSPSTPTSSHPPQAPLVYFMEEHNGFSMFPA
ncbi:uncharacterized protein RAG0_07562 [Rhynchosporium agropyri]|uniref:Uncharacterized protein n=1 Tax=Rhynchosporium agropyri TaxID=914238 RepID=A0A1E1KM28_9HELO|nr:uncharacterized protein RAG0_07562 [Rhynchosporium agropyri]